MDSRREEENDGVFPRDGLSQEEDMSLNIQGDEKNKNGER